jgi:trehalose transport system substrate-binding protein
LNESTYAVIRQGERVEIGFRPRTRVVSYIAYNLAEGDKIRVSVGLAPSERKVFEDAILPEFKRSTGFSVELVQIESGELLEFLREEAGGAGVIFDLLVIDNNSLAPLVAEGLVEDLTPETRRVPEEVLDSMLPVTKFGGRTFFFPFRPNVQITFYNSEKFGEMGVEPPRTWDELLDSARAMQEAEGKGRLALKGVVGGPNAVQVTEFIWQAGGDPLVLNDEGSLRAFEFLQELAPYLSDRTADAKFDTMNDYLAKGDVYLGQNWAFGVQEIVVKKGKREIQAYSGWSGPEGEVHVLGGDVLAVPKGTANSTDALAFAEYLMSKDVQSTLAVELAWPSIRDDAYDGVDPALKPYWDAINEAMSKAQARPNVPYWKDVEGIVGQAWEDIVINGMDVEKRLDFYSAEIERASSRHPEEFSGEEISRRRCQELFDLGEAMTPEEIIECSTLLSE